MVGDGTSVIGSIEVPLFGAGVGVAGDPADAVGVAVIGDDDDGIEIGCDCGNGDCCGGGFVFMYFERLTLVFHVIYYDKNKIK